MSMKAVFYSWQAQRPEDGNRYLIRDALTEALKLLAADPERPIRFTLEEDARGATGAAEISAVLLEKVETCSIFVADITPVGTLINEKITPNPNVLFELGYAWRGLGPERIVLVLNVEHGVPEELPFDISKRHLVRYRFPAADQSRTSVVKGLASQLRTQLEAMARDDEWRDLRDLGLEENAIALFAAIYGQFLNSSADSCSYDDVVEAGRKLGIDETAVEETIAEIADGGLWQAPQYASPRLYQHIMANTSGWHHYLLAKEPALFNALMSGVGREVAAGEHWAPSIAENVMQPAVLVEFALSLLESQGLIRTVQTNAGPQVMEVKPRLKRMFQE